MKTIEMMDGAKKEEPIGNTPHQENSIIPSLDWRGWVFRKRTNSY